MYVCGKYWLFLKSGQFSVRKTEALNRVKTEQRIKAIKSIGNIVSKNQFDKRVWSEFLII